MLLETFEVDEMLAIYKVWRKVQAIHHKFFERISSQLILAICAQFDRVFLNCKTNISDLREAHSFDS